MYSTLLACDSCPILFIVTLDLCRALSWTTQELTCRGIVQAQPLEVCMSLHSKFEVGLGESREMEWGGRVGGTRTIIITCTIIILQ